MEDMRDNEGIRHTKSKLKNGTSKSLSVIIFHIKGWNCPIQRQTNLNGFKLT